MITVLPKPFKDLVSIGTEAEDKFEALLLWHGKNYQRLGQENWLPKWVHAKLRFVYTIEVEVLRHIPDFATDKAIIQVKNAPDCTDYPTVTIQQSSYNVALFYSSNNIPVLILWMFPDKKFRGNWVDKIEVEESEKHRKQLNGSQTPMYLVRKNNLLPFNDFVSEI